MKYKTIKVGKSDPYYGSYPVWSCPCGRYDHGMRMVDIDNCGCQSCGVIPDKDELNDFYRRGAR